MRKYCCIMGVCSDSRVLIAGMIRAADPCENLRMLIPADSALSALARDVAARLQESKRILATAESCTGGWIAKLCTDIAGSSEWFDCGFVCYSNASKGRDLALPEELTGATRA